MNRSDNTSAANAQTEVKRLAEEYALMLEQHQEAWAQWFNARFAI
ncbi:MAG: hypothetical protein ACPGVU_08695 [Limisphaerales bacterium]